MLIGVTGLPGTGKTFVAQQLKQYLGLEVFHTDRFKHLAWDEQPAANMDCMEPECIIEGVTVARMLSRGFMPDLLIYLEGPGRGIKSMPWVEAKVRAYERAGVGRVIRLNQLPTDLALVQALSKVTTLRA